MQLSVVCEDTQKECLNIEIYSNSDGQIVDRFYFDSCYVANITRVNLDFEGCTRNNDRRRIKDIQKLKQGSWGDKVLM